MDVTGLFSHREESSWAWEGNEFLDRDGAVIAYVSADVLTVDDTRLLLEHTAGTMRFRMRGTSPTGTFGTMAQTGVTVSHMVAQCGERRYSLDRRSPFRKERVITVPGGGAAAYVRPQLSGRVTVQDGPAYAELPALDYIFLTWGCVLIDAPRRRTRI